MIDEAIILAGGLGTRLRSEVSDRPKPMVLIQDRPFLSYLLDFLIEQNMKKVILGIGYLGEQIQEFFGKSYRGIDLQYSFEKEPLGTGGALKRALNLIQGDACFVLNGDSLFRIDLSLLKNIFYDSSADLVLSLKEVRDSNRYGFVQVNTAGRAISFLEKGKHNSGLINGGVYCLRSDILDKEEKRMFSFEKFLEDHSYNKKFMTYLYDSYFIDIGIPEDYYRAQTDFE